MKEKLGYVAIEFDNASKQEVVRWASQLNGRDIVKATIEGKMKGGNVTDKLHLTLFYGLDENLLDQGELIDFIATLLISTINIVGIDMFPSEEFNCNVLYLDVADESGELKSAQEHLKNFPHLSKHQGFDYKPHITIAYVVKGFDIKSLTADFPKSLSVKEITYFRKS